MCLNELATILMDWVSEKEHFFVRRDVEPYYFSVLHKGGWVGDIVCNEGAIAKMINARCIVAVDFHDPKAFGMLDDMLHIWVSEVLDLEESNA